MIVQFNGLSLYKQIQNPKFYKADTFWTKFSWGGDVGKVIQFRCMNLFVLAVEFLSEAISTNIKLWVSKSSNKNIKFHSTQTILANQLMVEEYLQVLINMRLSLRKYRVEYV